MPQTDQYDDLHERWVPLANRGSLIRPWEAVYMVATAAFLAVALGFMFTGRTDTGFRIIAIGLPVFALPSYVVARAKRRLDRSRTEVLRAKEHRICPECLYDLTSTPSPGVCPECGTSFDAAHLPDVWRRINERWRERQQRSGGGG